MFNKAKGEHVMEKAVKKSGFTKTLESIGVWVEKYIAPPLVRFGNQRHMAAIRAGLIRIIPLIIVGSIPLIFTSIPFESIAKIFAPVAGALNALNSMTMGFMSLYLAISLGAELAKVYNLEPTTNSLVTVASFLIVAAPIDLENGVIKTGGLGAAGMFSVFIVAIIVAEVMRFCRDRKITIKMPENVPETISASFSSLIPMALLLVFFWIISIVLGFNLNSALNVIISPLLSLTDTWYAILLCCLLLTALWFVGIHGGSFTVWGVLYPFLVSNIAENAAAFASGGVPTRIFTEPFVFNWIMIGGVGQTLPLVLFYWKSKSVRLREVARVELAPGLFNINEPISFGVPVVLNPILLIPFVLNTIIGGMYGYILTKVGLISTTIVQTPWSIPPFIGPYLSTGGDWRAVVAQAVLLVIVGLVWYPFAKVWEKKCIEEESGMAAG